MLLGKVLCTQPLHGRDERIRIASHIERVAIGTPFVSS
jgi:hypothetical protein